MNFVKGAVVGMATTAAAMMIYNEMNKETKTKIVKKGKQFARKIGVL